VTREQVGAESQQQRVNILGRDRLLWGQYYGRNRAAAYSAGGRHVQGSAEPWRNKAMNGRFAATRRRCTAQRLHSEDRALEPAYQ
jgi:hypothetical protein